MSSKARAMLKNFREKRDSVSKEAPKKSLTFVEEDIQTITTQKKEDAFDPLTFLKKKTMDIKPQNINDLLKINSDKEESFESYDSDEDEDEDKSDDDEEEEEKKENDSDKKHSSFILRFLDNTPTKIIDTYNKNNDDVRNTNDTTSDLFLKNQKNDKNLSKIIEEEKESFCITPRTYRGGETNKTVINKKKPNVSSKNCTFNKTFCFDYNDNKTMNNNNPVSYRKKESTNIPTLSGNKSFVKKNVLQNKNLVKPKLAKAPQSFQSLTIKQKSLRMLKLGKKISECKIENNLNPKRLSVPELTAEQKQKFEERMRKVKNKKMFVSKIKSKRDNISAKIKQLSKKFEHSLTFQNMVDNVISSVQFPEVSIFDEDIGDGYNEDYINNKFLRKVNSKEVLNLIKRVEVK